MQSLSLYPANSLFVGGYLTTRGDPMEETFALIEDAGFEVQQLEGADQFERDAHAPSGFRLTGTESLIKPDVAAPRA